MDAMMLRGLVTVESAPAPLPSVPDRALQRTYPGVPQRDMSIELDKLKSPTIPGASAAEPVSNSAAVTPNQEIDAGDLEMSRPASPVPCPTGDAAGVDAMQSILDPYMNRFRFASVCLINFGNGLNDAAPGALLPYMETYYELGYALVSLIFVGNAAGFIVGAFVVDMLRERLGRSRILALAQLLMAVGYIPLVCSAPFPLIVVGFFLIGLGICFNIAMANVFCGSLQNGTTALGGLHGSYGIGGTVGPLIATAMVTIGHTTWSRYYFLTLGIALCNGVFAAWAFWHYEKELGPSHPLVMGDAGQSKDRPSGLKSLFAAFRSRVVLLGALFIFAYQGAEVSISGWVISFLISARQGDPSAVGYVTAGFWAGITIGRFLLSAPAHRVGEIRFVYVVVVGAAVFELLVWFVPNVIGDAVAVSIVGLLLGPVYPCSAAVFMRSMTKREQVGSMGIISAFGSSGGAAAPFTTGILAQAAGTFVLHPIAIGLFAIMLVCWYGLPTKPKRKD
jgi:fucose permease